MLPAAVRKEYTIAVLPGDGIGPEVTAVALRVLRAVAKAHNFGLVLIEYAVGGEALDRYDEPLPKETLRACKAADAVLLGAIGGPRWDHETGARRCETALLGLRKSLDVYANLRPVQVFEGLADRSPLGMDRVSGADILLVRELTGGIYFGTPRGQKAVGGLRTGTNTMTYREDEVARIARTAFTWARRRRSRVTSVDKANVLEVSQLWRTVVAEVHAAEFPELALDHLYVDNAAMQLILRPRAFDVILTGNLFGDILSDLAATLPGSLGLLPSASVGASVGLFEPVHGSAPDLAGQGRANPMGAVLSAAMMLESLGEGVAAQRIRNGVAACLQEGVATADLGGTASTSTVGEAIIAFTAGLTTAKSQ